MALLSTNHKCTHPCLLLLRRRCIKILKMMLSSRRAQPPVDCLWSWSHHFQDKLYNSYNLLIIAFTWYCYWLFTYNVSICMKLDPGIHIAMHSVLSLKPGVTMRDEEQTEQYGIKWQWAPRHCTLCWVAESSLISSVRLLFFFTSLWKQKCW